ncbi:MAG TPA: SH3 domain-containing protein [Chroococcales cyanobacterium]
MSLSGIAKFLLGFTIGILLLAGSGAAAAYYFWTKLSVTPPKPVFAEERPKPSPVAKKATSLKTVSSKSPGLSSPPTPKETPKPLPPGAYKARVTWSEGLIVRDAPSVEGNRVGGVALNQEVIVLKDSPDGKWQQVRITAEGEQDGWVRSGNVARMN